MRPAAGGAPDWLTAAPIAHRGLHGGRVPENSLAAAEAAVARGSAIECDVQLTADGEAVVFHDFDLERMTGRHGTVAAASCRNLAACGLGGTEEPIPTLAAFLDAVSGRVPIVCEIKSRFDGDLRLAERVLAVAAGYVGPLALKSFDPAVIAHCRPRASGRPLGIVAEATYEDPEWSFLPTPTKRALAALGHFGETRPDFLSFAVDDLPHAGPTLCRIALGIPVMAWTVRRADQRAAAATHADQMIYEGFEP